MKRCLVEEWVGKWIEAGYVRGELEGIDFGGLKMLDIAWEDGGSVGDDVDARRMEGVGGNYLATVNNRLWVE